ncbi:dienelactone hydrolase family protein [Arthrobacter ramosus]|uniref:Dienelactone hydrolase family protein n=1 Tax=Arthrobacter ramosus TaxID=1672 RepID=A0ABV5Y542_ARTRM|nr:dienelactone hydrolase family protein [Arthrobacter ramosus]
MVDPARSEVLSLIGLDAIQSYVAAKVVRGPRVRQGNVLGERIELWTDGGDVVPCLFLKPIDDVHQVGAVVAVHQHAGNYALGKSELAGLEGDPQMAFAVELAESGLPTLVPDLLGFEERQRDAIDPQLAENRDAEHLLAGGSTLQGVHTRDIAMATSWLEARDDVRGPLGIIGHSLGGQVGLFNLACDPRLRAGVLSCGIGTLESFEREGISHNPAWFVPELRKAGDVHLVVQAIENQRVLVVAGQDDPLFPFQDVQGLVSSFREGVADFVPFEGGHAFPAVQRRHAISWLKSRLTEARSTP